MSKPGSLVETVQNLAEARRFLESVEATAFGAGQMLAETAASLARAVCEPRRTPEVFEKIGAKGEITKYHLTERWVLFPYKELGEWLLQR